MIGDSLEEVENFFIDSSTEHQFIETCGRIGEGATSVTYKCYDCRTHRPLCKKVLKYNNGIMTIKDAQNALKEFEVLHCINHPCICKSFYVNMSDELEVVVKGRTEKVTTITLFIEFAELSLNDVLHMDVISNTLKTKIVIEVAHAMRYLHAHGMIHRDLKVENIMLNSVFQTKLVDFGLVRISECTLPGFSYVESSLTRGIGTLAYMSPEMLNEEDYDSKTDVYSFGVVLHAIFIGPIPKQSMRDKTAGKAIVVTEPESGDASQFCADLITRCLSPDPAGRPSFEEILLEIRKNEFNLAPNVDTSIIAPIDRQLEEIDIMK